MLSFSFWGDRVLAWLILCNGPLPGEASFACQAAPAVISLAQDLGIYVSEYEEYDTAFSMMCYDPDAAQNAFMELRVRYNNMRDAPPASDYKRFPSREICRHFMDFNMHWRKKVESEADLDLAHAADYRACLDDASALWSVWSAAEDVAIQERYPYYRRDALKKLKKILGDEAYFRGIMPPPVPLSRVTILP